MALASELQASIGTSGVPAQRYAFEALQAGAVGAHAEFVAWSNANPSCVNGHIALSAAELTSLYTGQRNAPHRLLGALKEELLYFSILNRGTSDPTACEHFVRGFATPTRILQVLRYTRQSRVGSTGDILGILSEARKYNEFSRLETQMQRLHYALPEFVVKDGGMSKVARTILGVLVIAGTHPDLTTREQRKGAILSTIPGAYAYAATYPIVDDVLQDSHYFPPGKADAFHDKIVAGLSNRHDIDRSALPDHPLVDELLLAYDTLRQKYPPAEHADLYDALLSMYLAQHEDALSVGAQNGDLFYPNIAMKSGLSRVVAHLLCPRPPDPASMNNLLRSLTRNQLLDDFRDQFSDARDGIITPFTIDPPHPSSPNPFRTFFAYNAYIAEVIYGGDPSVARVLAKFGGYEVAKPFLDTKNAATLRARWGGDPYLDEWMLAASSLPRDNKTIGRLNRSEKKLLVPIAAMTSTRNPQEVDPRTFLTDVRERIATLIGNEFQNENDAVHEVARYILEAESKYVRSGMTLMLAESLKISPDTLAPLLTSVELSHAASLLFDDLPAQDNATVRRGKPAAHTVFPESDVQLAGIAMISRSIGILAELSNTFEAKPVMDVISYVTSKIGHDLCLGQHMDLASKSNEKEDILKMYALKTSSLLEAALIPVMVLAGRSTVEIENLTTFAHHAGIVYQLQDDILDVTASSEQLGKKTGQDEGKNNIVRTYGVDEAIRLRDEHFQAALEALRKLPFETTLLSGTVTYFASRTR